MSLKIKAFQGIKWNTLSSMVVLVVGFVQLYILVRYLDKQDFGIMALGLMVLSYFSSVQDLGLNSAIVYKKELSKIQRSSIFWIICAASLLLFILMFLVSGVFAQYFDQPGLSFVIKLLACVILFDALGNIFYVLLYKELEFKTISLINISGSLLMFLTAVYLAINGYGVMSLVYAHLLHVLFKNVAYISCSYRTYPINFGFDLKEIRSFLEYGFYDLANKSFQNFTQRIDTLFIGKFLGPEILGVYDIFKNLLMKPQNLITPIFTNISFPLISKVKNQADKIKQIYLSQIEVIYILVAPIYLFCVFYADLVIKLYLGNDWQQYAPVFILLCIFFLIRISGVPVGGLLLAVGRVKHLFRWNIVLSAITVLALFFFMGKSLDSAVWALIFLQVSFVIPNYFLNVKPHVSVPPLIYAQKMVVPIIVATLSFAAPLILNQLISDDFLLMISVLAIGCGLYAVVILFLKKDVLREAKSMFMKARN